MGRRERPNVKGNDPAYSHTFMAERPRLPNGMPPSVVIPGLNDAAAKADAPAVGEEPKAEPSPDPGATGQAMKPTEPATGPKPKAKAKAKIGTQQSPAKPSRRANAERPAPSAPPSKDDTADDIAPGEKRKVSIKVSITTAHVEAMKPLVARGLAQRDVLALAGRRAMKRFDPTADLVPMPEGDRVPMLVAYSTTKYVPADMLDAMRDVHDPLRVKSDAAMVRGQFETLFWSILEEVVEELSRQKG